MEKKRMMSSKHAVWPTGFWATRRIMSRNLGGSSLRKPGMLLSSSGVSYPSTLMNSGCFASAMLGVAKIKGHPKSAM